MKTTITKAFAGAAALFALLLSPAALAQSGGNYTLAWSAIGGGGGLGAGGNYSVAGTVGQPIAGAAFSSSYTLLGGFWAGAASTAQPERPRLKITRGNGVMVLSWPGSVTAFRLQETSDLLRSNWSFVSAQPGPFGSENVVVAPITSPIRFYRLIKP
jgi:hypothetical protein